MSNQYSITYKKAEIVEEVTSPRIRFTIAFAGKIISKMGEVEDREKITKELRAIEKQTMDKIIEESIEVNNV